MAERLAGRTAIVTGAAQGLGAAITRRFVAEGARVTGVDRNAAMLTTLAAELPAFAPFPADVTDHPALTACVEQLLVAVGRIDILVNNAGFQYTVPFLETTLDEWRHTQAVNLEAQYVLCKLVAPRMIRTGYGRIVNIASTQAIAVEPNVSAYAASKGGVGAFTRSLAVELAPHGVLVNAVAPGAIHTPMSIINGVDELETEDFREWYLRRRKIPLGRPGQAQEVAAAALFLASEECSYVTGHTLVADGGLTITF
jgi:NAD(P)-dependent dehydrogenase (short-subunit alcohol dehydrogenase family)